MSDRSTNLHGVSQEIFDKLKLAVESACKKETQINSRDPLSSALNATTGNGPAGTPKKDKGGFLSRGRWRSVCVSLTNSLRLSSALPLLRSGGDVCHLRDVSLPNEALPFQGLDEEQRSPDRPLSLWEHLDSEAAKRFSVNNLKLYLPFIVISSSLVEGSRLAGQITKQGGEVHLVTNLDEALGVLRGKPEIWSMAVLDVDSFGGILELSDDLLDFRAEVPEVPVMLVSAGFSQDDLTEERLPMCDASVRNPARLTSIVKGVAAAIDNNKTWRIRSSALLN